VRMSPSLAGAPFVVGVDGSEQSLLAVTLAAHMAARSGRPLRVVHAFIWPELQVPLGPSPESSPKGGLVNDASPLDGAVATPGAPNSTRRSQATSS
jgi:nucleotide-binding universal stress UspA family protein